MIVAFTVSCHRQKYLHDALVSWAKVRGAAECKMLFALEPPHGLFPVEAFTATVRQAFPAGAEVHIAAERLRCLRNTHRAMELAFQCGEDFAVLAEEDIEVADDVLEYFAWARDAYAGDSQVLAVCAHARSSKVSDPAAVTRAPWFNPLVWGTWRDRWEKVISPNWKPGEDCNNEQSWDLNLMLFTRDGGYASIFPLRSRSVHRGESSTHLAWPLSEHMFRESVTDCYAPRYEPQAYREVEFPDGVLVV
jgi:hypothetical protein